MDGGVKHLTRKGSIAPAGLDLATLGRCFWRYAGDGMRYKVELGFIDPSDDKKNVFYSTYVEANGSEEAVEIAKEIQSAERPDLKPGSRWFWVAYETYEEI